MAQINAAALLKDMQGLVAKAQNNIAGTSNDEQNKFKDVLINQIVEVNKSQQTANAKQENYILGASDVSLPEVMVEMQKATIKTNFLIEARNKMVETYNTIMSMTI